MILNLLWVKWSIQKTYFWTYFEAISFLCSYFEFPTAWTRTIWFPPKKFFLCLWKFSISPCLWKFQNFFSTLNLGWKDTMAITLMWKPYPDNYLAKFPHFKMWPLLNAEQFWSLWRTKKFVKGVYTPPMNPSPISKRDSWILEKSD